MYGYRCWELNENETATPLWPILTRNREVLPSVAVADKNSIVSNIDLFQNLKKER